MSSLELSIRIIHVIAGILSLLSGVAALFMSLKPRIHRRLGSIFFYSMSLVFITAIWLAINGGFQFLFVIAILSYYSTINGIRALKFFKGKRPSRIDKLLAMLLGASGLYLFSRGIYYGVDLGLKPIIILHLVFGSFMCWLSWNSWKDLLQLPSADRRWFNAHRANMSGALIATFTAFSTTALTFIPPLLAWLGPAIILTPLLRFYIKKNNQILNTDSI